MSAIKTPTVPAVSRALGMMERIADSPLGLTPPELIELSGLAKSSVHSLLITMERCGYIRRDCRRGRYVLADKIFTMAEAAGKQTSYLDKRSTERRLDRMREMTAGHHL